MDLHYFLYQSSALFAANDVENDRVLQVSYERNLKASISGFLHREGNFFLQYLEGPKNALFATIARIGRDPRHAKFAILAQGALSARYFPDWQMGFVDKSQLSLSEMLEVHENGLNLKALDPLDLVVFLVANGDALRDRYIAA